MTQPSHPALIAYPAKAAFGRTLPKNKIYEHSGANTRLKDLFVKQVDQIVWQYKLAPETVNLSAGPGVPEIQVFTIHLKTAELHRDVLRCVDNAVQFPIIFELNHDQRVQVVAAYKRPNEVDHSRWVLSEYFSTDWMVSSAPRADLPVALHLGGLYERLLHKLIPLQARSNESLVELVMRTEHAQAKRREVEKAAARLEKERQYNRKVEINAALRRLQNELAALSR